MDVSQRPRERFSRMISTLETFSRMISIYSHRNMAVNVIEVPLKLSVDFLKPYPKSIQSMTHVFSAIKIAPVNHFFGHVEKRLSYLN